VADLNLNVYDTNAAMFEVERTATSLDISALDGEREWVYAYHEFFAADGATSFSCTGGNFCDLLICGGGATGGQGHTHAGGGGGGEVYIATNVWMTGTHPVSVAAIAMGGRQGPVEGYDHLPAYSQGNSTFFDGVEYLGGGHGGGLSYIGGLWVYHYPSDGASGGGGLVSQLQVDWTPPSPLGWAGRGIAGKGYNGAGGCSRISSYVVCPMGGGGGGAKTRGYAPAHDNTGGLYDACAGNGGDGLFCNIRDHKQEEEAGPVYTSGFYFGAGGGGSGYVSTYDWWPGYGGNRVSTGSEPDAVGGSGMGDTGSADVWDEHDSYRSAGEPNTGSGGASWTQTAPNMKCGISCDGAAGIVVVRYKRKRGFSATGGHITYLDGDDNPMEVT